MEIIDNCVDVSYLNDFYNLVNSNEFPWFYNQKFYNQKTFKKKSPFYLEKDSTFLSHYFFNLDSGKSDFFDEYKNFFIEIQNLDLTLSRIKINYYEPNFINLFDRRRSPFHTDDRRNHIVCIFFPFDSEGNFIIKGYNEIKPVKNRLVIFDGKNNHCFRFPHFNKRYSINFNYLIDYDNSHFKFFKNKSI